MIASLCLILLCQLAGEIFVRALKLPMPGPVVGMLILLVLLLARDRLGFLARGPLQGGGVEAGARGLLAHLSLLFVPVGVGVITHLDLISHYGFRLLAVIVVSTWIGMAVTALVLRSLLSRAAPAATSRASGGAASDE